MLTRSTATHPKPQGQESCQGGEGAIRKDGRKDAPEAGRKTEEEGEAKQAHQLLSACDESHNHVGGQSQGHSAPTTSPGQSRCHRPTPKHYGRAEEDSGLPYPGLRIAANKQRVTAAHARAKVMWEEGTASGRTATRPGAVGATSRMRTRSWRQKDELIQQKTGNSYVRSNRSSHEVSHPKLRLLCRSVQRPHDGDGTELKTSLNQFIVDKRNDKPLT